VVFLEEYKKKSIAIEVGREEIKGNFRKRIP
jgi:hypothetical protein